MLLFCYSLTAKYVRSIFSCLFVWGAHPTQQASSRKCFFIMIPAKEHHQTRSRRITAIEHRQGISLGKTPADIYRIISQCTQCGNKYVKFIYNEDEVSDYLIGDLLPGGQGYSG